MHTNMKITLGAAGPIDANDENFNDNVVKELVETTMLP